MQRCIWYGSCPHWFNGASLVWISYFKRWEKYCIYLDFFHLIPKGNLHTWWVITDHKFHVFLGPDYPLWQRYANLSFSLDLFPIIEATGLNWNRFLEKGEYFFPLCHFLNEKSPAICPRSKNTHAHDFVTIQIAFSKNFKLGKWKGLEELIFSSFVPIWSLAQYPDPDR